jgi:DNA-binding NtrC family response regulator
MATLQVVERLLVVEDCEALLQRIAAALAPCVGELRTARSLSEALTSVKEFQPQLIVLDVVLPDGTGVELLESMQNSCVLPLVVAMSGAAEPAASFRLAQLGVRTFLKKPVDVDALRTAIARAAQVPPDVTPHLRNCVGQRPVRELEELVRRTMVEEALARSAGSRRGAAKLLSVSRQLLQHMLKGLENSRP